MYEIEVQPMHNIAPNLKSVLHTDEHVLLRKPILYNIMLMWIL